jgi:hypothetical protein
MAYKISSASSVSEKCETWQQKIHFTRNKLHYETLVLVMLVQKRHYTNIPGVLALFSHQKLGEKTDCHWQEGKKPSSFPSPVHYFGIIM